MTIEWRVRAQAQAQISARTVILGGGAVGLGVAGAALFAHSRTLREQADASHSSYLGAATREELLQHRAARDDFADAKFKHEVVASVMVGGAAISLVATVISAILGGKNLHGLAVGPALGPSADQVGLAISWEGRW